MLARKRQFRLAAPTVAPAEAIPSPVTNGLSGDLRRAWEKVDSQETFGQVK